MKDKTMVDRIETLGVMAATLMAKGMSSVVAAENAVRLLDLTIKQAAAFDQEQRRRTQLGEAYARGFDDSPRYVGVRS